MSNNYYASPVDLAPGTKARASDINTIDQSVDAAFEKLPAELALKTGTVNYAVNKSGTANAYAVDMPPAVIAYTDGLEVKMLPGADNTGACTLNVNALGAIAIKRQDGTNALAGDLVGASAITLVYSAATNTFRMPPLANAQVTQAAASATAAASSASAASTSAGQSSASATAAATSATNAATSATNAGNSATAASQSAGNAATSAGQASGSASAAATSASNLAAAVTSASNSASAASTSAGNANTSAGNAATSAGQASASATAANTSATNAATSAGSASASAALAQSVVNGVATVRDTLLAIAQQVHQGAVVDVVLYDTSRDSDGGAWRKRCKHTSWENEPLVSGKWLGLQANLAAAQAFGGANGDYYQSGVDGRFYGIGTGEQFRGNQREFPAVALIVAEAGRLIIYDATQPSLPMWMVFIGTGPGWPASNITWYTTSAVAAVNGEIITSDSSGAGGGVTRIKFAADYATRQVQDTNFGGRYFKNLAARNSGAGYLGGTSPTGLAVIANNTVNDVAAIVLPDAPIDLATGLPVPTIAVATNGGVSVIKHDGSVVNGSYTGVTDSPSFTSDRLYFQRSGAEWGFHSVSIASLSAGFSGPYSIVDTGIPCVGKTSSPLSYGRSRIATRGNAGICLTRENPASYATSMVAAISSAYSSGWMVGDIRGAWLADTVAETMAGAELVANGTFSSNTSGWTSSATYPSTAAVVGGALQVTATSAYGFQSTPISCVVGKTYQVSGSARRVSGTGSALIAVVNSPNVGGAVATVMQTTSSAAIIGSVQFVATQTTHYVLAGDATGGAGSVFEFDNISARLADADRSVKAKGLNVNGSITKAAVAAGAQLVGYSGFSAANYLEQAYNSDLDFGTGDFCLMAWVKPAAAGDQTVFYRATSSASSTPANGINVWVYGEGALLGVQVDGVSFGTPANSVQTNTWNLVEVSRVAGVLSVYVNGTLQKTGASSSNLTLANAFARIGAGYYTSAGSTIALMRIGATVPSADQRAQIYRDELALFQASAQCTIDGTSSAVTALAYDDTTDLLHVGTSWGRTAFKGLQRVESSATSVGNVTALSAAGGAHITAGSTAARYVQPAMYLRDELKRKDEARRALGRIPVPHWFTGTGALASFTLPAGFDVYAVYRQGLLAREGSSNDYTATFDGYRWTVTFPANVPNNYNICIMGVRNGAN